MNQPAETSVSRKWPDLSMYGLYFGVTTSGSKPRLILIDESNGYSALATSMGFKRTRWLGVWIHPGSELKFSIPDIKKFSRAKVVVRTMEEINQVVRERFRLKQHLRLSKVSTNRMGWHPSRVSPVAQKIASLFTTEEVPAIDVVLNQTSYLGKNLDGDGVYEQGDGVRFISVDGLEVKEREVAPSARFLRLVNDDDIDQCLVGMVNEIASGNHLSSHDFIRYLTAIYGQDAADDLAVVAKFHESLDRCLRNRIINADPAVALDLAIQLHEGRPSYWRPPGTLPTPLPIVLLMQQMINHRPGQVLLDVNSSEASRTWAPGAIYLFHGGQIPSHDRFVGGSFNNRSETFSASGIKVERSDHEMIVRSLQSRKQDGISAYLVIAENNGQVGPVSRRLLSWVGMHHEVIGITDISSSMISAGNEINSRLIVVGRAYDKDALDLSYAAPLRIPVIYDYPELKEWCAIAQRRLDGEEVEFPSSAESILATSGEFQAPYIPFSQVSEPAMMAPRNLLAPTRIALSRITEESNGGVDDFVAEKLGVTVESLGVRFSAEQVDAIAMGIHRIDKQAGMVLADKTGVGKGRVLAALMAYAKKIGKTPLFVTETPDLYSAIYRDIIHSGFYDDFKNPLIMNSGERVYDPNGNIIARAVPQEKSMEILTLGNTSEYDCILATYGQFNREPPEDYRVAAHRQIYSIIDYCCTGKAGSFSEAISLVNAEFSLPEGIFSASWINSFSDTRIADAINDRDDSFLLSIIETRLADIASGQASHINDLEIGVEVMQAYLEGVKDLADMDALRIKLLDIAKPLLLDNMALRQHWIRNLQDFVLLADESHNMAGPASNTNANMTHAVTNTYGFIGSSATFASNEDNFGIYRRIFPEIINVDNIAGTLKKGGEQLAEILSGSLAMDGALIRREPDMSTVEFKIYQDEARFERNKILVDEMAEVLNAILILNGEIQVIAANMNQENEKAFKNAVAAIYANAALGTSQRKKAVRAIPKTGIENPGFGSRFAAINQQFIMSMVAEHVADLAIQAMKNGLKPVIYSELTMESALRDVLVNPEALASGTDNNEAPEDDATQPQSEAQNDSVEVTADSMEAQAPARRRISRSVEQRIEIKKGSASFKNILNKYVDSLFYIRQVTRHNGKVVGVVNHEIRDPSLEPYLEKIRQLIDGMPEISLSPIDLVKDRIREAGFTVDEISGRHHYLEHGDGVDYIVTKTPRKKREVRDDFNNGRLNAAIITKSGATGTDMHASEKFADQSQRVFIPFKVPNDIVKFVQGLGRVHRKDQVCAPKVYIPCLGLPGEKRLITYFKKKTRKMSASVTANAETENKEYESPDIINKIGNKICLDFLLNNPDYAKRLGFDGKDLEEVQALNATTGITFIDKVTGRIAMLRYEDQEFVYKTLESEFNAYIARCEAEGWNPLHAHKYDYRAKENGRAIYLPGDSGSDSIFSGPVHAVEITWKGEVIAPTIPADTMISIIRSSIHNFRKKHRNGDLVATTLRHKAEKLLPKMISEGQTVEELLASEKPNRVKNFKAKIESASSLIEKIVPGCEFTIDTADGPVRTLILEVNYPSGIDTNLGMYEVRVMSDMHPRGAWIDLTTLVGMHDKIGNWITDSEENFIDNMEEFIRQRFVAKETTERRVVLTGNLYRAAELAAESRKGAPISYTDENGVWRQAIGLAKGMSLKDALSMPIKANTPELAADFIREVINRNKQVMSTESIDEDQGESSLAKQLDLMNRRSMILADSFSVMYEGQNLTVRVDPNDLSQCIISCYGNKSDFMWLLDNSDLVAAAGGSEFSGQTSNMRMEFDVAKVDDVMKVLIPLCNKHCEIYFSGSGGMREWYIERQDAINATVSLDDITDEINLDDLCLDDPTDSEDIQDEQQVSHSMRFSA